MLDLRKRSESFTKTFRTVEYFFKFVNWMFVIAAVKTAEKITGSRVLEGAGLILSLLIFFPFVSFIYGSNREIKSGYKFAGRLFVEFFFSSVLTIIFNWRLNIVIDALVNHRF